MPGGGEADADADAARVVLCGWVDRRRDLGGVCFVDLRDHTGLVQVVVDPEVLADAAVKLHSEDVLCIEVRSSTPLF